MLLFIRAEVHRIRRSGARSGEQRCGKGEGWAKHPRWQVRRTMHTCAQEKAEKNGGGAKLARWSMADGCEEEERGEEEGSGVRLTGGSHMEARGGRQRERRLGWCKKMGHVRKWARKMGKWDGRKWVLAQRRKGNFNCFPNFRKMQQIN